MSDLFEKDKLREYVEQIELCEGEKADYAGKINIMYSDAKADGLDVKAMRQIIKERKMMSEERKELLNVVDSYRQALGM